MPRASIIMPCYNHANFVEQSVRGILDQTFGDFELFVVDDASKDDSVQILRRLAERDTRIKVLVHEKNLGASRSRNDGLRAASGEFVAFCDADDVWKSHKLERQIKLLSEHPEYDVIYSESEVIDGQGQLTGQLFSELCKLPATPSGDLFEPLCVGNFINMQTVMARRQAVGDRLCFDEGIKWVEDWWQWIRVARNHRFLYEPGILAQYRIHQESTGLTQRPGIGRNRLRVFSRNLREHSDMPPHMQARIRYEIGRELCQMGKRRMGCRFLWHSVDRGRSGGMALRMLTKMTARASLESGRRAVPV